MKIRTIEPTLCNQPTGKINVLRVVRVVQRDVGIAIHQCGRRSDLYATQLVVTAGAAVSEDKISVIRVNSMDTFGGFGRSFRVYSTEISGVACRRWERRR